MKAKKQFTKQILSIILCVAMLLSMASPSLTVSAAPDTDYTGYYKITNAGQLAWFACLVVGDTSQSGITEAEPDAKAVLTADIDITVLEERFDKSWVGIGTKDIPFTGIFDGNGYTIKGLTTDTNCTKSAVATIPVDTEKQGLFGVIGEGGIVRDVVIEGTATLSDGIKYGAICSENNGTIENVLAMISTTGGDNADAICHTNNGTIINCFTNQSGAATGATIVDAEELASGSVAYALGASFGQIIGTDTQPVHYDGTNGIYKYGDIYTNTEHTHSWSYTASQGTITANCTADDCPDTDGGSITISAPESILADGNAVEAVVTNELLDTSVEYTVTYSTADGNAPATSGTYMATLTLGDVTASVEYMVATVTESGAYEFSFTGSCDEVNTFVADVSSILPEGADVTSTSSSVSSAVSSVTPTWSSGNASIKIITKVLDEPASDTLTFTVRTEEHGDYVFNFKLNLTGKYRVNISGIKFCDGFYSEGVSHKGYSGTPVGTLTNGSAYDGTFVYSYADAEGNALDSEPTEVGKYTVTISVPEDNENYKGSLSLQFEIYAEAQASWQTEENGEWISGTFTQALAEVYSGGTVKLLDHINLETVMVLDKDITITSSDAENPCIIGTTLDKHGYLLTVTSNVTLENVIVDGGSEDGLTATRALVGVNGGKLILNTGAVIRNNKNTTNQGIGGGVCVISGELILNGGTVTGNNAYFGGGVGMAGGTFNMTSGSITGNSASIGGGVCVWHSGEKSATMNISGGSVTNNSAQYYAGGIDCYMTSTVNVSGNPVISGNTSGEETDGGIYPDGNKTEGIAVIKIGELNDGADITFYSWLGEDGFVIAHSADGYTLTNGDLGKMGYDGGELFLALKENQVVLSEKMSMTEVSAEDIEVTYDGAGHSIKVNGAPEGAAITYSTDGITYGSENPVFTNVADSGTVYYKVSHENYNDFTGFATVTINKATLTVTQLHDELNWYPKMAESKSTVKGYFTVTKQDGTDYSFTVSEMLDASGNTVSKIENAEVYTIKIAPYFVTNNYAFSEDTFSITVNPLDLSELTAEDYFSVTALDPTYTGQTALPQMTESGKLSIHTYIYNVNRGKDQLYALASSDGYWEFETIEGKNSTDAGDAYANIVGNGGNVVGSYEYKYTIQQIVGTVNITNDLSKTYDGAAVAAPEYTRNNTSGEVVVEYKVKGADDSTYSTTAPKDAGEYTVRVTVKADAEGCYTEAVSDPVDFEISKKAVTVTAGALFKHYGEEDPTLTYTAEGVIAGETLNGELERTAGEAAGTYDITQGTLTDENNPNYAINFTGAKLTIAPDITITDSLDKDNVQPSDKDELEDLIKDLEDIIENPDITPEQKEEYETKKEETEDLLEEALSSVIRLYGPTRYETALKVADELKAQLNLDKFDTVIIASGQKFADALSGTYLASQKNAPILMTNGKNIDALKEYVSKNLESDGMIYILGGEMAVSAEVEKAFADYTVKRLAGETRIETNLEILKEVGVTGNELIVSTSKNFADSLSASASDRPILLAGETLTDDQREFLSANSGKTLYVIGGTSAVSTDVETELADYGSVERIGGATRYETSVLVAKKFFADPDFLVLAYAKNFPDGLCGGVLAAKMNAPIILTESSKETNDDAAIAYGEEFNLKGGAVLGGDGLISDETVRGIYKMSAEDTIIVK